MTLGRDQVRAVARGLTAQPFFAAMCDLHEYSFRTGGIAASSAQVVGIANSNANWPFRPSRVESGSYPIFACCSIFNFQFDSGVMQ